MAKTVKERVHDAMKKTPSPFSTKEMKGRLRNVSESAVQKAFSALKAEGVVVPVGDGSARRWRLVDQEDQIDTTTGENHSSGWGDRRGDGAGIIADYFKTPKAKRRAVGYDRMRLINYDPERPLINDSTLSQLQAVGVVEEPNEKKDAGTFVKTVIKNFLADLSFNSSRLEGNTISLADTYELFETDLDGVDDKEKIMLLNHRSAISWMIDNIQSIDLSAGADAIKEVNYYLMQDIMPSGGVPGAIREVSVGIGGSSYKPATNRQILSDSLNLIAMKANTIADPYEQSFFFLLHVSYIQAFRDGNKRTARLMANLPLIRDNLIPQSFHEVDSDDYKDRLVYYYETADHMPFLDIFANGYIHGSDRYKVIEEQTETPDIERARLRGVRNPLVAMIVRNKITEKNLAEFIATKAPSLANNVGKELKERDLLLLLAQVATDLNTIKQSKTGLSAYGLTDDERREWLDDRN